MTQAWNSALGTALMFVSALSIGLTFPFIATLPKAVGFGHIMTIRGLVLVIACVLLGGSRVVKRISPYAFAGAVSFTCAAFLVLYSIKAMGPDETVVVFAMLPVFVMGVKRIQGAYIPVASALLAVGVALGIAITLEPWKRSFTGSGCAATLAGVAFTALLMELMRRASDNTSIQKSFAVGSCFIVAGMATTSPANWSTLLQQPALLLKLTALCLVLGPFKIGTSMEAMQLLPPEAFAVLTQLEVPICAICSFLILGKPLTLTKCIGILLTFSFGALSSLHLVWLQKKLDSRK